ncbi:MAG: penicillin acylase family protein, partial [Pseudomonadota bacterium]
HWVLLIIKWFFIISLTSAFTDFLDHQKTDDRISVLETIEMPELHNDVTIYWNRYMVPFVVAEKDSDAAFMLGVLHAHLRLEQMEVAKRMVYGRIAEMAGPFANDIDKAIRILNPTQAVDRILVNMPQQSKDWMNAFVKGINHYKQNIDELPHVMQVLNIENEPWSVEDTIALVRLGGYDVNWFNLFTLLEEYQKKSWDKTWQRVIESQHLGEVDKAAENNENNIVADVESIKTGYPSKVSFLLNVLSAFARTGSNSFAISGSRTATGAPMIANDPHLSFTLPNLWMIAGVKSPSYHVVGMMPVGIPIFGIGRNRHIAWGSTNIRQEATDFVDVSALKHEFEEYNHEFDSRF